MCISVSVCLCAHVCQCLIIVLLCQCLITEILVGSEALSILCNRQFPSCLSPLFQSESWCEAFHMEISFIHSQILVHLHVTKTKFHVKGFAPGLSLKKTERRKETRKSPIEIKSCFAFSFSVCQLDCAVCRSLLSFHSFCVDHVYNNPVRGTVRRCCLC